MRLRAIHDKHYDMGLLRVEHCMHHSTTQRAAAHADVCMVSPPRTISLSLSSSVRVLVGFGRRRRDIVGERGRVLVNHGRIDAVNLHLALDLR